MNTIESLLATVEMFGKSLNTRAAVEQEMWNIVKGKAPLPDVEKCRDWARRLGIPEELRVQMDAARSRHDFSA